MSKTGRYPILLKPPHFQAESAADYLIRVFQANGYPWSVVHLAAHGIKPKELLSLGHGAAKAVAKAIGRQIDDLDGATPSALTTKAVKIAGEIIHRDHWTTEDRKWCPACWEADLLMPAGNRPSEWNIHRRFWWGVTTISSCPIHKVRLRSVCPHRRCDRPVLWYVGSMLNCQDKHDLLGANAEPVADHLILPDAYVVGRLGGMPRTSVPLLDQLPLGEAIEAITRLGVAALGGADLSLRAVRTAREPEMMAAGYRIAAEWPERFLELLKAMPPRTSTSWGAEMRFGQLYKWARELPDTPFGREVRRVFFGHIGETGHVKPNSVVADYAPAAGSTLSGLAGELAVTAGMLRKYLEVLGIEVPESGKGFPTSIDNAAIKKVRALFEGRMILMEAASYLGIGRKHVRELIEIGMLVEDPIHKGVARGRRVLLKADVDKLVSRASQGLKRASKFEVAKYGLRPLPKALGQCRGIGIGQVCQMLVDGTLKHVMVGNGQRGLAAILTTATAIMEAARRQEGGSMSCREAAEVLQLHPEDMRLLVKAGAIEHKLVNSNHISIPRSAVTAFGKQFVSSRILAGQLGITPNKVSITLRKKGKRPVYDRQKVPGFHGSIYSR